ncbi:MAG: VOC family protein [Saprospiraceae bacterium]|nr:VOC family protein [Saprospiraceae bacterium]
MQVANLGTFSISLAVKNMQSSLSFYEALGFQVIDGGHVNSGFPDTEKSKWRILASQETKIGLFEGMFPENILTFYPPDVRAIQRDLKASGIPVLKEADETTQGPESIILEDPDGNRILLDQQS